MRNAKRNCGGLAWCLRQAYLCTKYASNFFLIPRMGVFEMRNAKKVGVWQGQYGIWAVWVRYGVQDRASGMGRDSDRDRDMDKDV